MRRTNTRFFIPRHSGQGPQRNRDVQSSGTVQQEPAPGEASAVIYPTAMERVSGGRKPIHVVPTDVDLDALTQQHTAAATFGQLLQGDAGNGPSTWIPTLSCRELADAYDQAQEALCSSRRCGRVGRAQKSAAVRRAEIAQAGAA